MDQTDPKRSKFNRWRREKELSHIEIVEQSLYGVAALLLTVTALVIIANIIASAYHGIADAAPLSEIGVGLIDQILLLLIIAELIHTIRIVIYDRCIHAELFLLIGLIVIVRRVVIVTAQAESLSSSSQAFFNLVLELGMLGLLAVAFGIVIYLLRKHPEEGIGQATRELTNMG